MSKNFSPWIYQLDDLKTYPPASSDQESDIAIIGGGIAGISTAFFLLRETNKKIILLERFRMARGATGHNAGQLVSYFEQGFARLVEEYGIEKATAGQRAIEETWGLVDDMYTSAGLDIPLSRFVGHAGLCTKGQVLFHLKNNYWRRRAGLTTEQFLLTETCPFIHELPDDYNGLYTLVSHDEILKVLETENRDFIGSVSFQKGVMNSALFCQEILAYLVRQYPDRLKIFEHSKVEKIVLHKNFSLLDLGKHVVKAKRVVLCTNGFEDFSIFDEQGLAIDHTFHHEVRGVVGFMSGYLEKMNKSPVAISYFENKESDIGKVEAADEEPYIYLTRRPYEYDNNHHNLISIGGPEKQLEDKAAYSYLDEYPETVAEYFDAFIKHTYDRDPNKKIDYIFTWHGLMGYTRRGIRLIGEEPRNRALLYNLGCNGVGLLPSIYGGWKVTQIISGHKLAPSIFDVEKGA